MLRVPSSSGPEPSRLPRLEPWHRTQLPPEHFSAPTRSELGPRTNYILAVLLASTAVQQGSTFRPLRALRQRMQCFLGTYEGELFGWNVDPDSHELTCAVKAHDASMRTSAVVRRGKTNVLLTAGSDGSAKIYDLKASREVGTLLVEVRGTKVSLLRMLAICIRSCPTRPTPSPSCERVVQTMS